MESANELPSGKLIFLGWLACCFVPVPVLLLVDTAFASSQGWRLNEARGLIVVPLLATAWVIVSIVLMVFSPYRRGLARMSGKFLLASCGKLQGHNSPMTSSRAVIRSEQSTGADRLLHPGWLVLMLVVIALLAVNRRHILTSPPSQENVIGLWKEADFLSRTNFDYQRLWYEEPDFSYGCARTYLTSAMPTVLALLMKFLPAGAPIFFVLHMMSIVSAAIICVVLLRLLMDYVSIPLSILTCLALLTNPMFSGQTYIVGMELPMTAFGMIAIWLACKHRFHLAGFAALAAFFMKASGIVFELAIISYLVILLATEAKHRRNTAYQAAVFVHVIFVGLQLALIHAAGSVGNLRTDENQHSSTTLWSLPDWCPDFLLIFAVSLFGTSLTLGHRVWKATTHSRHQTVIGGIVTELGRIATRDPFWSLAWIMLLGGLVAIESIAFIPRYLIYLLPFLYAVFVIFLASIRRGQVGAALVLIGLICFNTLNTHGSLYPQLANVLGVELARTGGPLDRSHEVVDDHLANLAAMRALAETARNRTIIAGRPYLDFLAMPDLKYIDIQATVYGVNPYSDQFPQIRDIVTILDDPPLNPIFIVVGNSWLRLAGQFNIPRPTETDHVIYTDHQPSPLVVFEKRWPAGTPSRRQLQDWYLDRMWPHVPRIQRDKFRISFLRERGDTEQAVTEALRALQKNPRDFHLRQLAAALLFELGRMEDAIDCCLGFLERDRQQREAKYDPMVMARYGPDTELVLPPTSAPVAMASQEQYEQGLRMLYDGRPLDAVGPLQEAARLDAKHTDAIFCLGMIRQEQSQLAVARDLFQTILQHQPTYAPAAKRLAQIALAEGELMNALRLAKIAVREGPNDAAAHHTLGLVLARMANYDSAVLAFEQAVAIDPTNNDARRNLDRIMQKLSAR